MIDFVLLVIASLACFRMQELITVDDGPGDVFLKLRSKLGAYYLGADGQPQSSIGRGIICPYCVGVWIAALLAIVVFPIGLMTPVYWFAIAGGAAVIQTIAGRV